MHTATDHYTFANNLFNAIVETLAISHAPAQRATPDPLPEVEKPPARAHRKSGLGGRRIA